MIDSITFSVPVPSTPIWEKYLNEQTARMKVEKNEFTGYMHIQEKNMIITPYRDRLYIHGSFHKYLRGENVSNFDIQDMKKAVELFETKTGISIKDGILNKIEVCIIGLMKYPPFYYMEHLGACKNKRYEPTFIGKPYKSVYYGSGKTGKELYFYDKGLEARKYLPKDYEGCNILKIEMRINKKAMLQSIFKKDITVKDLWNVEVLGILRDRLIIFYENIEKTHGTPIISKMELNGITPNKLDEVRLRAFKTLHPDEYEKIGTRATEKMDKQNRERVRKKDKKRMACNYCLPSTLIQELDNTIINATF